MVDITMIFFIFPPAMKDILLLKKMDALHYFTPGYVTKHIHQS